MCKQHTFGGELCKENDFLWFCVQRRKGWISSKFFPQKIIFLIWSIYAWVMHKKNYGRALLGLHLKSTKSYMHCERYSTGVHSCLKGKAFHPKLQLIYDLRCQFILIGCWWTSRIDKMKIETRSKMIWPNDCLFTFEVFGNKLLKKSFMMVTLIFHLENMSRLS